MQGLKHNKIYLSETVFKQVSHLAATLAKSPEKLSQNRVIICEEKFTLSVEKALSNALCGIMTTRVMPFGKICDEVKSREKYLSKTCEIMLLSKLISEISGELELFSSASLRPSFAGSVYDILSLLSSSHVDFQRLENQNLPPALKKKIADICKINKAYQQAKAGLFLDATDKMQALYSSFDSVDVLKGAEIFIVGHTAFTNQMLAVISKMAARGSLTVYLLSRDTMARKNIAAAFEKCDIPFTEEQITEDFTPLQKVVFQTIENADVENSQKERPDRTMPELTLEKNPLTLLKSSCEQFECENVTLKIAHLLEGGVLPEEISVTLANFEGLESDYYQSFEKYNIPYFASVSKTLEQFPFPQHILNLAEVATAKYSLDSVRRILKSPFSPLSKEESFTFENFLISRNVDRGRFFKDEIFTSDGMLEVRDKFASGTAVFAKPAISASEFASVCENLAISALPQLSLLQHQIAGLSEVASAEFFALSIKKTLEVLQEMTTVLGDEIFTLERLISIFEGGLCGKEIAIIPASVHAVEICDISKSILSEKSHAFICGASKSFFPAYQKDTALLSDKDILALSLGNIDVSPSVEFLNDKQDTLANLSLLSASDHLTISYSEIAGSGKETACEFFGALSKITPVTTIDSEYHFAIEKLNTTLESALETDAAACEVANITLFETVFCENHAISLFSTEISKENRISAEITKAIFAAFEKTGNSAILENIANVRNIEFAGGTLVKNELSASQLEQYFKCPYSSFLAQNIRLYDREVGVLKEFDTGNFLHYLLEEFSLKMGDISQAEIAPEVEKIAAGLKNSPAFAKFANQEKFQFVLSRLTREAEKICNHIYKSKEISAFVPTLHELRFGGKNPVVTDGGLALRGVIDRVDICGDNAIVVDYKTGHIDLSDSAFYHGLKLQSELYLYAISRLTGKNPCGCLYLPISDDFKSTPPTYKMRGKLLHSEEFLSALDKTLENSQSSEIYPIAKTKVGGYKKSASLLDRDAFEAHIKNAVKTAECGKAELSRGYISPSPYIDGNHDSCKYCRYVSICKSCGENSARGGKLSKEDN